MKSLGSALTSGLVRLCFLMAFPGLLGLLGVLFAAPISVHTEAVFGLFAVLTVLCLKPFTHRPRYRYFLLTLSSVVILHFFVWRLQSTLPMPGMTPAFILGVLLVLAEAYSIHVFFTGAYINADHSSHDMPAPVAAADLPSVDIFIPSYNEPTNLLAATLAAARNIHYPRHLLTVTLCDDGGTDEKCNSPDPATANQARARRHDLMQLCKDLGVRYVTRARNTQAKAGNVNAAMGNSHGELVAIFDADHVPTRDFLARTVGYFVERPRLFLVQTPHFFLNTDPIQRNIGLSRGCPPEYEMFYAKIHRGLDRLGGAFFCGPAALLRRKALDEVGGISTVTITEDAETALDLHARGWESMYLDRAMVAGLQPETFLSFIKQRARWAAGMIQMLRMKNPAFRRGLSFSQRLCYLNSITFWLFPVARMIFLLAPLVFLFFGLQIFVASLPETLALVLPYVVVSFIVQNALYHDVRWPLVSEVYEVAQTPFLFTVILRALFRPKGFKFHVTAKDEQVTDGFISPIFRPLLGLFAVEAAGVVATVIRWIAYPDQRQMVAAIGGWALFNLLLVGCAIGAVSERQQRRSYPRVPLNAPVRFRRSDAGDVFDGTILDASVTGMRILARRRIDAGGFPRILPGTRLQVQITGEGAEAAAHWITTEVREMRSYADHVHLGLEIVAAEDFARTQETLSGLIFADSERWLETRRAQLNSRGIISGLWYMLGLSLTTTSRVLSDILSATLQARKTKIRHAIEGTQHNIEALVAAGDRETLVLLTEGSESQSRRERD